MRSSRTLVMRLALAAAAPLSFAAHADSLDGSTARADSHAPIGVMADHTHKAGEVMVSYRYGSMTMSGNRIGTDSIDPDTIATTVPNRFFGNPMQPPTLRVVPIDMTMQMHMVGVMYAPSDVITLMAMTKYIDKEMDHITYQGGMGTTRLGTFTTQAKGMGDTTLAVMVPIAERAHDRVHVTAGLSIPTGSITERDQVLAPNGMQPTLRLPYPMQLGSGSYDWLPSVTWAGHDGAWSVGAQYNGVIRLADNDEDYRFGDVHRVSAWGGWLADPSISLSLRAEYEHEEKVEGIDDQIVAPVQTANPAFQGGQRLSVLGGLNWLLGASGSRLAFEMGDVVWQDLNGPQLERDVLVRIGFQQTWK